MRIDRPIAIAVSVFAVLLLAIFLVWPEYQNFRKLQADLGEKKAQYLAEFDYYAEITKKYFELQNRQNDLKKIDDALPSDPDLGKIIYYLQKTSSESGMLVKDLFLASQSSAVDNTGPVKDLSFSMDLIGSYSALGQFLSAIERSDRIFEVASITFSSQAGSPLGETQALIQAQQIYSFSLQVKTYSY